MNVVSSLQCYFLMFQNNLLFTSRNKLCFIELQDEKLSKIEDFHKRVFADVIFSFKGR